MELDEIVFNAQRASRRRHDFPALKKEVVILKDSKDPLHVKAGSPGTAWIEVATHDHYILQEFIDRLASEGMDEQEAIGAILDHEIGHSTIYPRELSDQLQILAKIEREYPISEHGDFFKTAYALYADISLDVTLLANSRFRNNTQLGHGGGVGEMRRHMAKENPVVGLMGLIYQYGLRSVDVDLGLDMDVYAQFNDEDVLIHRRAKGEPTFNISEENFANEVRDYKRRHLDLSEKELRRLPESLEEFSEIRVVSRDAYIPEGYNLSEEEFSQHLTKLARGSYQVKSRTRESIYNHIGSSLIFSKYLHELFKDANKNEEYVDCCAIDGNKVLEEAIKQLDHGTFDISKPGQGALDEAIRRIIVGAPNGKFGQEMSEEVKKLLRKVRPDFYQSLKKEEKNTLGIGLEGSDFTLNNHLIDYYNKRVSNVRIPIAPKTITSRQILDSPDGRAVFEVQHAERLDYTSSPQILPEITLRHDDTIGIRNAPVKRKPDAMLLLDSSGSMPSPEEDSPAIQGGFVLAKTYRRNGSRVGVVNFSADMAILPPTRDLNSVYQMLCGYFGGGTVVNVDLLQSLYQKMMKEGDNRVNKITLTNEKETQKFIESLGEEERKSITEKVLNVNINQQQRMYGSIDNHLISDGGIANKSQFLDFLNGMGRPARNTLFIIQSKSEYEEWKEIAGENTTVHYLEKAEDMRGMAIKHARAYRDEIRSRK